jgi:hypothetical protein
MGYDFAYWCKASYFDTSALVKLVSEDEPAEEPGREAVRKYYWSHIAGV